MKTITVLIVVLLTANIAYADILGGDFPGKAAKLSLFPGFGAGCFYAGEITTGLTFLMFDVETIGCMYLLLKDISNGEKGWYINGNSLSSHEMALLLLVFANLGFRIFAADYSAGCVRDTNKARSTGNFKPLRDEKIVMALTGPVLWATITTIELVKEISNPRFNNTPSIGRVLGETIGMLIMCLPLSIGYYLESLKYPADNKITVEPEIKRDYRGIRIIRRF